MHPFNQLSFLVDINYKYGIGNNSFISATPNIPDGYECAIFGFFDLIMTAGFHAMDIRADNESIQAGSQYGGSINVCYGGYYVKTGVPYIVKELLVQKEQSLIIETLYEAPPGYKFVGAVIHASEYSSTNSSNITQYIFLEKSRNDVVEYVGYFPVSNIAVKLLLLYVVS